MADIAGRWVGGLARMRSVVGRGGRGSRRWTDGQLAANRGSGSLATSAHSRQRALGGWEPLGGWLAGGGSGALASESKRRSTF